LERGAHLEADEDGDHLDQQALVAADLAEAEPLAEAGEDEEPEADVEDRQADAGEAHDGAGAEGDLEAGVQGLLGGRGGAGGGVGRRLHAEPAAEGGEEAGDRDADHGPDGLEPGPDDEAEEGDEADEDEADDLVLAAEVG